MFRNSVHLQVWVRYLGLSFPKAVFASHVRQNEREQKKATAVRETERGEREESADSLGGCVHPS